MTRNWLANMLFDENSDNEFQLLAITVIEEEEEMANEGRTSRRRGSILGHTVIQRDRVADNDILYHHYFTETPTFSPCLFRRRFRMNHSLFSAFNMVWKLMIHTLSKEGMLVEKLVCHHFIKFRLHLGCLRIGF